MSSGKRRQAAIDWYSSIDTIVVAARVALVGQLRTASAMNIRCMRDLWKASAKMDSYFPGISLIHEVTL